MSNGLNRRTKFVTMARSNASLRDGLHSMHMGLLKYGTHTKDCKVGRHWWAPWMEPADCSCGWAKLLAALEQRGDDKPKT